MPLTTLNAFWVHGNSVIVQEPFKLDECKVVPAIGRTPFRVGWGAQIWQSNNGNWFHFVIPTTVISNGDRAHMIKIFLYYHIEGNVTLTNVHIWDGHEQVREINGLTHTEDNFILRLPRPIEVHSGIQICACFKFNGADSNILFRSAGVDCLT